MYAYLYVFLVTFFNPHTAVRIDELASIAMEITETDATEDEGFLLVGICIHESRCTRGAIGDGGRSRGAWQVRGRDVGAAAALAKVRWSYGVCGDLSLYAGCGRCGSCPDIVQSLEDPTLPRK
jgi:hypothetical protein